MSWSAAKFTIAPPWQTAAGTTPRSTWEPSLISPNTSICSSPPAVPLTARLIFKFTSPGNSPSARNSFIRLPVRFENESEFHTARAGLDPGLCVRSQVETLTHVVHTMNETREILAIVIFAFTRSEEHTSELQS